MVRISSQSWHPVVLLFVFSTMGAFAQLGEWSLKSSMPTARKEIANAGVVLDGKIYIIGGVDAFGNISAAVEVYDPVNDQWSAAADLPLAVWRTCAAAANGKLYVFGGFRSLNPFPFNPINQTYEYDPATDQWEQMASMPTARGASAVVTVDGKIHILGGAANSALSTHEIYDPGMDTWQTAMPLPTPRSGLTAAFAQGRIYAVGGYVLDPGVVFQDVMEAYAPDIDSWETMSPLPIARVGIAAVALNEKMYVFGGTPNDGRSHSLEYDPLVDQWRELTEMPTPVSFLSATAYDNTIFVVGGGPVNLNRFDAVDLNRAFVPPGVVSAPNVEHRPNAPFELFDLYPNPGIVSMVLKYVVYKPGMIDLRIYDIHGREITILLQSYKMPGTYYLEWNTQNDVDMPFGAGRYFLRARMGTMTMEAPISIIR